MEAASQSPFHDTISDETNQSLADAQGEIPESRDENQSPTELSGSNTTAAPSNAILEPTETLEPSEPPQALVIFVLGEHRFSDTCELGVMNEYPEALQAITSNQCLSTSAFLKPALHAAMAELRPSMMVQVAVRLTAITLRLAAKILRTQQAMAGHPDVCDTEQEELSETVRRELEKAVPYYQWQGPRNYYGRVQYLMALLQEAIGAFAVPPSSLAEALKQDVQASQATKQVVRSVLDSRDSLLDVCGAWAAEHLLSSCKNSSLKTPSERNADAEEEDVEDANKTRKLPSCMTPNHDLEEEELPSPSTFIRKKPIRRTSQNTTTAEVGLRKAMSNDDDAKQGSQAGTQDQDPV